MPDRMQAMASALMQANPSQPGAVPIRGGGMMNQGLMQGMGSNGQARNPMAAQSSAPGTMYADRGAMVDARHDFKDSYSGDGKWRNAWNDQNNGFVGQQAGGMGGGGMATTPIPGNTGIVPPHMNPSPVPMPPQGGQMTHMGPGSGLAPMPTMPPMNSGGIMPPGMGSPMPGRPDPRPMNPALGQPISLGGFPAPSIYPPRRG